MVTKIWKAGDKGSPTDFFGWAKAFLQAIRLSRAGIPWEVERKLTPLEAVDFDRFSCTVIQVIEDCRNNDWYNGFRYSPRGMQKEISWNCKAPNPATAGGKDRSTVIYLAEESDGWQIRVSARDDVAADARIRAAQGKPAKSVPKRIVEAQ
jgi:hypothetical protein